MQQADNTATPDMEIFGGSFVHSMSVMYVFHARWEQGGGSRGGEFEWWTG